MNEQQAEQVRWHDSEDVSQAIKTRLATVRLLGWVEERKVNEEPEKYVREVCVALAGAVASMPAVQRAMSRAYPGTKATACFDKVVRSIAAVLSVDADSVARDLAPRAEFRLRKRIFQALRPARGKLSP